MSEPALLEYRRRRSQARAAFNELVEALNKRDTCDLELAQSRHPLPQARIDYLTAQSILWHHVCEHHQQELDAYAMKLKRLARELLIDEFEPDESPARRAERDARGFRRTGDVGPATRAPRGSAADAQQQLFA